MIFFDSHGAPWLALALPAGPSAQAVGPTGAARPLTGFFYGDIPREIIDMGEEGDFPVMVSRNGLPLHVRVALVEQT